MNASSQALTIRRASVVNVVGRLALVFFFVFLGGCGNYKIKEYIIGYKGPAQTNPFLGAERVLTGLGCSVQKMDTLDFHRKAGGVLFTNPGAFRNYGDTRATMDWVDRGGHLVLFMSEYERWRADFGRDSFKDLARIIAQEETSDETEVLLNELGVKAASREPSATAKLEDEADYVRIGGRRLKCFFPGELQFKQEPRSDVRSGGKNPVLVSFTRNGGRVTLLASAQPFRNRWLGDADHSTLLWDLVELGGDHRVWFCDGARVSFLEMLRRHGWRALIAVALLIVVWLWKNLPRFGPLRATSEESARDFTAHLELTGAFLWRQHEARSLLGPTQRAVTAAIMRAGWHPTQPDYFEKVAARTGLTAERAQDALTLNDTVEPQRFQRLIQDLQAIREKF